MHIQHLSIKVQCPALNLLGRIFVKMNVKGQYKKLFLLMNQILIKKFLLTFQNKIVLIMTNSKNYTINLKLRVYNYSKKRQLVKK